jgi:hypothetical protein
MMTTRIQRTKEGVENLKVLHPFFCPPLVGAYPLPALALEDRHQDKTGDQGKRDQHIVGTQAVD